MVLRSGPLGTLKVQVKTLLRGPRRGWRPIETALSARWSTTSPWAQSTPAALRVSDSARLIPGPAFFLDHPFADHDELADDDLGGSHDDYS